MHPITLALLGILAYRTYHGKGRLAELIGHRGPSAASGSPANAGTSAGGQDFTNVLGSLGAAGAPLAQGLSDLFRDFQTKGFGETIKSWVEQGPNKSLSAAELERALGNEKIEWLMKETGLSREALLEGLSRELPATVDQLTPDGRLPSEQEAAQRIERQKAEATASGV